MVFAEPVVDAGRVMTGEPIAVVGCSCRLPGAPGVAEFWQLLSSGGDAVRPLPEGRPGPAGVPGGYLDRVDEFDAAFFGVPFAEAVVLDPQQRLMLELGWEALEDTGIVPGGSADDRAGVFVGAIADDYATL